MSSILIGGVVIYICYLKIDATFTDYFVKTLQTIGEERSRQVKLFLEGKQNRVVDFSSDGFIKNSLYDIKRGNNVKETVEKLNHHLVTNKMPIDKYFYGVFALGVNGVVVASTDEALIGLDLAADPLYLEGRNRAYVKNLSYDVIANVKSFVLSAPVIRENEFVGVIAIKMLPDTLMDTVFRENNFSERLVTYVIDKDGYLVTPSKFLEGENKGILTQIVDTENTKKCLKDVRDTVSTGKGHELGKEDPVFFVDYRGIDVIGTHHIIPEMNWCLLAEIDYSVAWEGKKDGFKTVIIILFAGAGIAALFNFFIAKRKKSNE